jgi:hypothetical protein
MCKSQIGKRLAPQPTTKKENLNIGLLNMSSQSMSTFCLETIIEIISLLILSILVIRWIYQQDQAQASSKSYHLLQHSMSHEQ